MIGTIEFYIALISSLAFFSWGAFGLWQLRCLRQKQRREMSDNQEPKPIAPPRNCDRFADELEAQLAFLNEVWLISVDRETMLERDKYENWSDEMRTRYGRWLFAHATEREGEWK